MYTSLMIDLVKSRRYSEKDRYFIQHTLLASIDALNECFGCFLEKPVEFCAGDEVQGLFNSPQGAYQYYRILRMILSPWLVRAGLGVGNWSLKIEDEGTTVQDGTAYHAARMAINDIHETTEHGVLLCTQRQTYGRGMDRDLLTINALMQAEYALSSSMTITQRNIALLMEIIAPLHTDSEKGFLRYQPLYDLICNIIAQTYEMNMRKQRFRGFEKETAPVAAPPPILGLDFEKFSHVAREEIYNFSHEYDWAHETKWKPGYYVDTRQRGVPTFIAELMGTSRQNIEKIIEAGHIHVIRNLSLSAMLELKGAE